MGKPNGYNVSNPEVAGSESTRERKKREARENKFRREAFRLTRGQLRFREDTRPHHAEFDDANSKGGRAQARRKALDDQER